MTKPTHIFYTDSINKNIYRIPTEKSSLLEVYKNRYAVVVALTVLMGAFIKNIPVLIGFGVVLILFTEYLYRMKFLKEFTIVPNAPEEKKIIKKESMIFNSILYILLGALFIYLALVDTPDGLMRYVFLALGSGSVLIAVQYLLALRSK